MAGPPRADPALEMSTLEELRRTVELLDHRIGGLLDYIDRGRPDQAEKESAERIISECEALAKAVNDDYVVQISRLRRDRYDLVERWVADHVSRLDGLVPVLGDIASSELERSTLAFVIDSLKKRWHAVLSGEDAPVLEHPRLWEGRPGQGFGVQPGEGRPSS